MRAGWLPTRLQSDFIDLINKRIVGSLMPDNVLKRAAAATIPPHRLLAPST